MNNGEKQSVVIANNDVVYLWWSIPKKIKDCLGFSIHRIENGIESEGLYATVGFDRVKDKRKSPQTTDAWPVQSFNWKDLYAPHEKEIKYKIIPMIGTWEKLSPDTTNIIETDNVKRTQRYGDTKIVFNRGILSTQAFAKSGTGKKVSAADARKLISNPTSEWRNRLGGQILYNVYDFFNRASKEGGKYFAALYELTDSALIKDLTKNKSTELILSNANSSKSVMVNGKKKTKTINDGTNKKTRRDLKKIKNIKVYDRMLGSHIGHNKFVVYIDKSDKPKAVLTGSTNWTPTGLCGQTNNMIFVESDEIAKQYMDYWNQLKADIPEQQGVKLRTWCSDNYKSNEINQRKTKVTTYYSPNTTQKNKPKNPPTPVDMGEVFKLIRNANESLLFLLFNPGTPSIIDEIQKVAAEKRTSGNPIYVRGAVSDAKVAKSVTTNIFSGDLSSNPDTYYFDRVTGVAAIPGPFSYFEDELLKIGFATIHDKILVIDPFSDNCVVVTGSHNLGFKASYTNDENMLIIQNDKSIAQAYATHVLDIVNHFKWRYKLQNKILKAKVKTVKAKQAVLEKTWNDLDETDKWMNYYFDQDGFINRNKFLF